MTLNVQGFFDEATNTISYLVSDPATQIAAIIDPVLDYEPNAGRLGAASADHLIAEVARQGLNLKYVLETHAHADHLTAAHHIRDLTGAKVVIGAHIEEVQKLFGPVFDPNGGTPQPAVFDQLLREGDHLPLGELEISVIHTPGHTPACVTYLIDGAAFVGDTLFMPDYGTARADFPGGDARTLYRSIQKILALPDKTRIFVGHDYLPEGRTEPAWETTVGEQRDKNIHVGGGVSEDQFVAMREKRDKTLGAPRLILPSLQVNIQAGELPPRSSNGQVYFRIPINALGK